MSKIVSLFCSVQLGQIDEGLLTWACPAIDHTQWFTLEPLIRTLLSLFAHGWKSDTQITLYARSRSQI